MFCGPHPFAWEKCHIILDMISRKLASKVWVPITQLYLPITDCNPPSLSRPRHLGCQECRLLISQSWAFSGTCSLSKETSLPQALSFSWRWPIFDDCHNSRWMGTVIRALEFPRRSVTRSLMNIQPFPLPCPASLTLSGGLFLKFILKISLLADLDFTVCFPENLMYGIPIAHTYRDFYAVL